MLLSAYSGKFASVLHFVVAAALASLLPALSTTSFAFGACGPLSATKPYHSNQLLNSQFNRMGSSQSSQPLSSTQSTDSIRIAGSSKSSTENEIKHQRAVTENNHHQRQRFSPTYYYEPPKSPSVRPMAHYIFLVHGWLGNDLEMDYLASAIREMTPIIPLALESKDDENSSPSSFPEDCKRMRTSDSYESRLLTNQYDDTNHNRNSDDSSSDSADQGSDAKTAIAPDIIIHSVKCNVGRTHDGIRMGGTRLADEIIHFIRSDVQRRHNPSHDDSIVNNAARDVTYSIVGNSLGGLYARYALSLIPHQIPLLLQQKQQQQKRQQQQQQQLTETNQVVRVHPNVFCTTATPHLGVSRHTYLPIPRIAERLIGTGMGTTGRDLFRLNSEKEPTTTGGSRGEGARRLSSKYDAKMDNDVNILDNDAVALADQSTNCWDDDDEEMECIIRNMCLQERYLSPLRKFRRRIAYANVYGTDFQVPTVTAAFLNERSGVGHFLVASRQLPRGESSGRERGDLPSFIVAVVCTEQQSRRQSPSNADGVDATTPSDELLGMSQSLDALGWTKVFIDVRDRIPIPGLARPTWFRPRYDSLDDLICKRIESKQPLTNNVGEMPASSKRKAGDDTTTSPTESLSTTVDTCSGVCILTSQDLAQSTQVADSIHFPMGHTVMIANAKNEQYSQWNRLGRPVMDRLAEDMVKNILAFE